MNFGRGREIRPPDFPRKRPPEPPIYASARNLATCEQSCSKTWAPASRREWSIAGPRLRPKPPVRQATRAPENAPPGTPRPPPPHMTSRQGHKIRPSDFSRKYLPKPQIYASARNRATCEQDCRKTWAPAGRRERSISGPRLRPEPPVRQATPAPDNAPPKTR